MSVVTERLWKEKTDVRCERLDAKPFLHHGKQRRYLCTVQTILIFHGFARRKDKKMTLHEKVVLSAYTGILMCDFSEVHKYIEKLLGRPVWTHELASEALWSEIKEKAKPDFHKIIEP